MAAVQSDDRKRSVWLYHTDAIPKSSIFSSAVVTSSFTAFDFCISGITCKLFGYYNTVEVMALATVTAARVNSQAFSGIMWGGTAASLCFLIFRVFVRLRYFRILYADDFFVLTAWIMLLANSITWQTQQAALYDSFKLSKGQLQPTADMLAAEQSLLRANLAVLILFLFCLWSVKISLLVFFRRLGHQVRGQKIWWWFVVGSTILTWAICISVLPYRCLLGSADYILSEFTKPIENQTITRWSSMWSLLPAKLYERHLSLPNCRRCCYRCHDPVNSNIDDVECPHRLGTEARSDGPFLLNNNRYHCLNTPSYFGKLE